MIRRTALIVLSFLFAAIASAKESSRGSGSSMVQAAKRFLNALGPSQLDKAVLPFESDERYDWHYVPKPRKGIPLKEMEEEQLKLAMDLLHAGLSQRGYLKATTIMSLELILRDIEGGSGPTRDPALYYFSVFGKPSETQTWGWRVEGHHVSLNFTLVRGHLIASTPLFLGANPAEVKEGPRKGLRALPGEEDLARELFHSLDGGQRTQALIDSTAPADIITKNDRKADLGSPKGLRYDAMAPHQQQLLIALLEEYARSMPEDLAKERMDRLHAAGIDAVRFAWAGGGERGEPHYYRVQGSTFLVEYDNTQNNANHIHSVWRDFDGDWGEDLLKQHYDTGHSHGQSHA